MLEENDEWVSCVSVYRNRFESSYAYGRWKRMMSGSRVSVFTRIDLRAAMHMGVGRE